MSKIETGGGSAVLEEPKRPGDEEVEPQEEAFAEEKKGSTSYLAWLRRVQMKRDFTSKELGDFKKLTGRPSAENQLPPLNSEEFIDYSALKAMKENRLLAPDSEDAARLDDLQRRLDSSGRTGASAASSEKEGGPKKLSEEELREYFELNIYKDSLPTDGQYAAHPEMYPEPPWSVDSRKAARLRELQARLDEYGSEVPPEEVQENLRKERGK